MSQDFSWLGPPATKHKPSLTRLPILDARNVRRDITCSAYRAETGLELRTEYGPEDIIASQLFRGADADERLAEMADKWRRTLIAKGFHEIAT